jgi:hypothetical protein
VPIFFPVRVDVALLSVPGETIATGRTQIRIQKHGDETFLDTGIVEHEGFTRFSLSQNLMFVLPDPRFDPVGFVTVFFFAAATAEAPGNSGSAVAHVRVDPLPVIDPDFEFKNDFFIEFNTSLITPPESSAIPEPGTLSLAGLAGLGIVIRRRRS